MTPADLDLDETDEAKSICDSIRMIQGEINKQLIGTKSKSSNLYTKDMLTNNWYVITSVSDPFYSSSKDFDGNYSKMVELKAYIFGYSSREYRFRCNESSIWVQRIIEGYKESVHTKRWLLIKNRGMRKSMKKPYHPMWDVQVELYTPTTQQATITDKS